MRRGLLGLRADRRGLAIQTQAFARHMKPSKILGIDMGHADFSGFDCPVFGPDLGPGVLHDFFRDLDVVWCAETPYTFEALHLARVLGVASVVQGNYEFLKWLREPLALPDEFWAPSDWNLDQWPSQTRLMPFPVDRQEFGYQHRPEVRAFLHIAGTPAINDRNGTIAVIEALSFLREPTHVIIRSQKQISARIRAPKHVQLDLICENLADNRDLYEGADVLVMPRRYGGLSLPMNEACSLGMAVIASDVSPQNGFLPAESLVKAKPAGAFRAPVGRLQTYSVDPRDLAAKMDEFTRDPSLLAHCQAWSDLYASGIDWLKMESVYWEALRSLTSTPLNDISRSISRPSGSR